MPIINSSEFSPAKINAFKAIVEGNKQPMYNRVDAALVNQYAGKDKYGDSVIPSADEEFLQAVKVNIEQSVFAVSVSDLASGGDFLTVEAAVELDPRTPRALQFHTDERYYASLKFTFDFETVRVAYEDDWNNLDIEVEKEDNPVSEERDDQYSEEPEDRGQYGAWQGH